MQTTVSVPPHLHASLAALLEDGLLPRPLLDLLEAHIKPSIDDSSTEIPYDTLRQISQWARADDEQVRLKERVFLKIPKTQKDPADYSMIALLSGTVTAPSAKLPPYKAPPSAEEVAILRSKERKAISAVINGFLSSVAVGVATWWLGGSIHMRLDYKTLLSVFAAFVVAISEAILYWIWQWRYEKAVVSPKRRGLAKAKKTDGPNEVTAVAEGVSTDASVIDASGNEVVRKRKIGKTKDDTVD